MPAPHNNSADIGRDEIFRDTAAIHNWVQALGGVAAAARALNIDHRTMQRFFSGAMPMKLRLAKELAGLAGDQI